MAAALCGAPDPVDPSYEPCILSADHGEVVPHLWTGRPCRHFRTTVVDGAEQCLVCGRPADYTCKHCGVPVVGSGSDWLHLTTGGYPGLGRCQHPFVLYGHLAEPVGTPCRADGPNRCLGSQETPCTHLAPQEPTHA